MLSVKDNFDKGIDLDDNYADVPRNAVIDGLNICVNADTVSQDKRITNIVGNRVVNYTYHAGGTPKTIGKFEFKLRNTVIEFAWHPTGYHAIIEYNNVTRVRTKIFENLTDSGAVDVLGFTRYGKITSVNIFPRDITNEGDLLFFLDTLGRPTTLNIRDFKAGLYTPVTRKILNILKAPPLSPPTNVFGNDTTRRVNNFRKTLCRFKYRWIYDNNETSVFSPISSVALPASILDDTFTSVITNNNVITVVLNSGGKNIKAMELAMSYVNGTNSWSDFMQVAVFDKAALGIADDIDYSYQFYNDGTYPYIDINESIQLYDYVPDRANAMDMPNGNVLLFGGITEGYNRTLTPNVVNVVSTVNAGGGGSAGGTLTAVMNWTGGQATLNRLVSWIFSGVPAVGTVINIQLRAADNTIQTVATYTTILADTPATIVSALKAATTTPVGYPSVIAGTPSNPNEYLIYIGLGYIPFSSSGVYGAITITAPAAALSASSIATWKWSTERNIAIAYFDENGKTNGILYTGRITFPAYADTVGGDVLLPTINTKIYHVPPDWAYSYQFYFNKEGTQYLYWASVEVITSETNFVYFEVSNFAVNQKKNPTTATNLSYSFKEGDRVRLIKAIGSTTFFNDTHDAPILGLVFEPTIGGTKMDGKTYIKIKKSAPFTNALFTPNNHAYLLEIYSPAQQTANDKNEVFYEFGRQYAILNPTTGTRVHAGQVSNQSTDYVTPAEFNFTEGDSYFRQRSIAQTESGIATFYAQDRNFVDFYPSAVSSLDGRPNIIDVNARRTYNPVLVRFSQAYQADTNINGTNRFYPNNFDQYELGYGDIMRFKVRDRFVRVFQKYKVGSVPLFHEIAKSGDSTNLVVTDRLLNPINYYSGDVGIGTAVTSLASGDFADYFIDNYKGIICRVSNNGIDKLSEMYKLDSWSKLYMLERIDLLDGVTYSIYGVFHNNRYIIASEEINIYQDGVSGRVLVYHQDAFTFSFNEKNNSFEPFLSFHPEMMVTIGTLLITWLAGQLYTHDSTTYNNFYGVQYDSTVTLVFNDVKNAKKVFQSITLIASAVWDAPVISTSTNSYGTTKQASNLVTSDFDVEESEYHAALLKDTNSIGGINNGDDLRGNYLVVKLRAANASNLVTLNAVSVFMINSPLNQN